MDQSEILGNAVARTRLALLPPNMMFRVNASKRPGRSSSPAFISPHETQTNAATPRNSHPNGLSGPPGIGPAPRNPPTAKRSAIPVMINLESSCCAPLTASGRLGLPSFVGATFASFGSAASNSATISETSQSRSVTPARTFTDSVLSAEVRPGARAAPPRPRPRPGFAEAASTENSASIRGVLAARETRDAGRALQNPSSCRHCLRRRAQQTRRPRLRLRGVDLFEWAERQ